MDLIFFDIGLIIIVATIAGYIARLMKQPTIPAYILAGVIIGPVLGLITNTGIIMTLSEIGIAFLLFMVGLEMDIKRLKNVAKVALIGGSIQLVVTFILGFLVANAFGMSPLESVYAAFILTFSSTMVVIKLLADKRELDTLHARMIIGILLMQDIAAIFALSILSTTSGFSPLFFLISILKGATLFGFMLLMSNYLLPKVFKHAAKSREMLLLMALTVMFFFSVFANKLGGVILEILKIIQLHQFLTPALIEHLQPGFSIAIGAFMGGVSIANLPYKFEIHGKTGSLRDFFSTIFFVALGMQLLLSDVSSIILPLVVFALFVVLVKPFIIMMESSFFGYKKRPSFLTALSLAQVSEFSLIIVTQGLYLGHVSSEMFSMVVILAVITIATTSYFIKYDNFLYRKMANFLSIFERTVRYKGHKLEHFEEKDRYDVVLCGYNRIGFSIFRTLQGMGRRLLIVDYNPEVIKELIHKKVACIYGDIGDTEVIEKVNFKRVNMVVSTVPGMHDNLLVLKKTKEVNKKAVVYVTANKIDEALELYDAGADYVILAHFLGGEHVSVMIENFSEDINNVLKTKLEHIQELKERKHIGHEHPEHA